MSTSAPIPLIQNGLVLSYDTYNIKSYRGEPTTNLVPNADTMASWSDYTYGNDGTFITEFGTTGYRMINRGSWNGIYKSITLNSTGNHTFSAYIRYWGGASNNNGGTVYTGGFGVSDSAAGVNKNLIGVWQRITLTINATSTSGTLYLISFGGTYGGDNSTWEVTMPQVEKNTHATQFVNGTRSNTDGLIDLTRNYTADLTNAGYDSGANINFGGSNAIKINSNSALFSNTFTWTGWHYFTSDTGGYSGLFWAEGSTGGGSGYQYLLSCRSLGSNAYAHYRINNTTTGWNNTDTGTLASNMLNTWMHTTWTFNGGTTKIYIKNPIIRFFSVKILKNTREKGNKFKIKSRKALSPSKTI